MVAVKWPRPPAHLLPVYFLLPHNSRQKASQHWPARLELVASHAGLSQHRCWRSLTDKDQNIIKNVYVTSFSRNGPDESLYHTSSLPTKLSEKVVDPHGDISTRGHCAEPSMKVMWASWGHASGRGCDVITTAFLSRFQQRDLDAKVTKETETLV